MKFQWVRKYRILIGITVIALSFAAWKAYDFYDNMEQYLWPNMVPPAWFWVDMDKPLEEQTTRLIIGQRQFEIPTMYIEGRVRGGVKKDSVFMTYVLPDFKSKLQFRTHDEYRAEGKAGNTGGLLLEESAIRTSFDRMIERRLRGIKKVEPAGIFDGLEVYKWYHRRGEDLIFYYEMYFEKDKTGKIISFIECSTKHRGVHVKYPGCSHHFRDKNLIYDMSYNKKKYLSSWQEQRRKAIEFIDNFEITAEGK